MASHHSSSTPLSLTAFIRQEAYLNPALCFFLKLNEIEENTTITLSCLTLFAWPWPSSEAPDAVWPSHYFPRLLTSPHSHMTVSLFFKPWAPLPPPHCVDGMWKCEQGKQCPHGMLPTSLKTLMHCKDNVYRLLAPLIPMYSPSQLLTQRNQPWSCASTSFPPLTLDPSLFYLCRLCSRNSLHLHKLNLSRTSFLLPCIQ